MYCNAPSGTIIRRRVLSRPANGPSNNLLSVAISAGVAASAFDSRSARAANDSLVTNESFAARAERESKADAATPAEIATLSKLLLGPLAGRLNTRRLMIVPDGALQYIPFQILLDPDSHATLIVQHEIVNQPSASTLAVLLSELAARATARNSIAVFADPVFEDSDPRLKRNGTNEGAHSSELLAVRSALRDAGVTADGLQVPRLIASGREADEITALAPRRTSLKAVGFQTRSS